MNESLETEHLADAAAIVAKALESVRNHANAVDNGDRFTASCGPAERQV